MAEPQSSAVLLDTDDIVDSIENAMTFSAGLSQILDIAWDGALARIDVFKAR